MLQFSQASKNSYNAQISLDANQFVEAFVLLNNDINLSKQLLKKLNFIAHRLNIFPALTWQIFEEVNICDGITLMHLVPQCYSKSNAIIAEEIITSIISFENDTLLESEALLSEMQQGIKDGSTLAPYILCKQILATNEFAHSLLIKDNKKNSYIPGSKIESAKNRIDMISFILKCLEANLSAEESQIAQEIFIYCSKGKSKNEINFIYDSELYLYLRNGIKFNTNNTCVLQHAEFKKICEANSKGIFNLIKMVFNHDLINNKRDILIHSGLLSGEIILKLNDIIKNDTLTSENNKLSSFQLLMSLYTIKDELIYLKKLFTYSTEKFDANKHAYLVIDFEKLGMSQELKNKFLQNDTIRDIQTFIDPSKKIRATETIKQSSKAIAIIDHDVPKTRTRTEENRIDLAKQREARKRTAALARITAINSMHHLDNHNRDLKNLSYIKLIETTNLHHQWALLLELFCIHTKSFSRENADTLFKTFNGKISDKRGSHVSLFLPDVNGVLKFIGATSFHSKTSNCAELESLSMLRQALYNHLSINTITKLQESLHNNLYKPARGTTNYMQQHKLSSS